LPMAWPPSMMRGLCMVPLWCAEHILGDPADATPSADAS
jgi:hypothetical protein